MATSTSDTGKTGLLDRPNNKNKDADPELSTRDRAKTSRLTEDHMEVLHEAIEEDTGTVPALLSVVETACYNLHEATKDTSMDQGCRERIAHEIAHLRSAVTKIREIKLDPALAAKDEDAPARKAAAKK